MIYFLTAARFDDWRDKARNLLAADISPDQVIWNSDESLFGESPLPEPIKAVAIQKDFMPLAQNVSYHRTPERWAMLYQAAWRLTHGEPHLLKLATDPLVHALYHMEKAVKRDAHKAKAFVRFRKIDDEENGTFAAWHQPDHFILRKVAPFFARRYADMRWSILTPDECAYYDGENLAYSAGVDMSDAPKEDALEELWKDYYRATFNPARIKIAMMKSEMPVRYWKNLPETQIIADMLEEAPERVRQMLRYTQAVPESAEPFLPESRCLKDLRAASKACEGCSLYKHATQTVFGKGPEDAGLMLVGEQPGDEEDKRGHAFVGPAGQVLQSALDELGILREKIYITNAVKHFKFTLSEGRRIHRSPSQKEINSCLPWLKAEIEVLKPAVILGLGVTAGKALLGPSFVLGKHGSRWHDRDGTPCRVTYHPSAILRASSAEEKSALYNRLQEDISEAAKFLKDHSAIE